MPAPASADGAVKAAADMRIPATTQAPVLTAQQEQALAAVQAAASEAAPPPLLLFGNTGSGKTEVYLQAVAQVARALTTSSGPGFSLKQEGISYLAAADLPAVIVDVMRIGSGLGDIAQGQGDYWQLTRGGGHGDYRTLVLAPASVQENADLIYEAFDLAERYRHPVLIASDAAIGQMVEAIELPEFLTHDINRFDWAIKGCKRGDEHKKIQNVYYTHPDYETYLREKYKDMEATQQRYENIGVEDAQVVLVAYGISSRICREAVEQARGMGMKVGLIRPISLYPFPVKAFLKAKEARAFLTVEMNVLGQMVDDVRLSVRSDCPVEHYGSIFEIPEPDGVVGKVKKMLESAERR